MFDRAWFHFEPELFGIYRGHFLYNINLMNNVRDKHNITDLFSFSSV